YKEILIDEYQDTNEAQNKIFRLISRDCENMYVVGDVKQSIYRFRLASPDLFIKLKDELNDYDGSKKPSKIILEKNFRSREGIDKTVNFIFSRLMTRAVGEIDYNEDEYLYFGADYYPEKHTPDTEIICINDEDCEEEISEPQVVASYIKRVMSSGVKVTVKDSERNIKWGDFCILLRSTKNKAEAYAEALKANGIPVSVSTEEISSDYKEIQFLSSLIRVVNNPLIDIPLISVLMSPVFGFTADELAEIRMIDSKADLYVCLVEYAKTSVKAESFLRKLKLYRNVSASHSVDELVKYVINDLSVYDIYYAAGEGEQRRANIKGFISFAENFVENGRKGLNDFVRALNYAIDNGEMKSAVNSDSDDNCVKIMSIHKSKGLEFPYVILADCSKGFNRRDCYNSMTLSKETGIGLKIRDDELFTRYHSLSSSATEKAILFGDISEEIRILYVALTRAKEHLAFICDVSGKTLRKKVRLNSHFTTAEGKISPYAVYKASNMSEWLLSCFAFHKDCKIVRDCCGVEIIGKEANTDFGVDVSYVDSFDGVVITDNDENGAEALY
ncbi:MAG: UvrD-helicase domain-containing protein, partial [Clostridia bacterium]|nr:UvrD-helicase domain-containing protein [Clostridia bacterium]